MSQISRDASEKAFQQNFVDELKKYKWEAPDFLDGNKHAVTVDDLVLHWRKELNRMNADQLEGVELTDNEFNQVLAKVNQISNSYEAAKVLSIEGSIGKIDGILRDSHPRVTNSQITLKIFKKAEVRGGDSSYRIAREVRTKNNNRFDIVLLINGLPLINIEQKRTDKSLDEAFGQFKRYYRDGEYCYNFMAFSQMMVMITEIETRYFATPKSLDDFNPSFVFHWADKNNTPINDWMKIVEHFLMIPMAHQMVGDYLIIDEARNEENRRHMLMRPYQVYALQAIEAAAFGWDNETKTPHGGFVWHTTGSGKTITSFKTALFLSTRAGFDKVVFLVDRRELDSRTAENFKAYAAYEAVEVDDTRSTYQLKKQLSSAKTGIVVTTTFKLNALVKELSDAHDESMADKRIVFIIDEAHRTTMGRMMGTIQNYFKRNGLFYGFTGTPLFDENKNKGMINDKSELIDTTEKLFGKMLHKYTIDEAISDGNVLGFHIDYINTGEFKSYDDLREKIIEDEKEKHPEEAERDIERKIQGWDDLKVETCAIKRGFLIYQDETHIPRVVTEILSNWEHQSQKREFNAILTVGRISRVLAYYEEFKKQMEELEQTINIAVTFSFGNENDIDRIPLSTIHMIFEDYAKFTGIEFVAGDRKHGEDAYFEDLIDRATRGGSGRNHKNIDLIIVADQLLTGYDSKRLNTLYVDRLLELQGMIQAYSRTNRVFGGTKEFGSIVNFLCPRMSEAHVNNALTLYGSGGKSSLAIVDHYDVAVKKFRLSIDVLIQTLPEPTQWQSIKNDNDAKNAFGEAFLDASANLLFLGQYYEFKWDDDAFGLTEHRWLEYYGAFKNLFAKSKHDDMPESINVLAGQTKLVNSQIVDAPHILSLIGKKSITSDGVQTIDDETLRIIHEEIQELSNMGEDNLASLLKEFVDEELISGKVMSNISMSDAFEQWKKKKINTSIIDFSYEWGINSDILTRSMNEYIKSKSEDIPLYNEIIKSVNFDNIKNKDISNKLDFNMKLGAEVAQFMFEVKQRYYL